MITDSQVWEEMESRGIRTQYDDSEYWGVGESFDRVRIEMELEIYNEIKSVLEHPMVGYSGDKLTKTASKLQQHFLITDIDEAAWLDEGIPAFDYKDHFVTIEGDKWIVEDFEELNSNDLLAVLLQIDLLER